MLHTPSRCPATAYLYRMLYPAVHALLCSQLHKAPAAFGLSTYLRSTGEKKRTVVQQLLLFSFAAPFGAFATYYGMYMGLWGYKLSKIALIMLFSGGTFLFVATVRISDVTCLRIAPLRESLCSFRVFVRVCVLCACACACMCVCVRGLC